MASTAWLKAHGRGWTRGPAREVYDNPWINVTEYQATAPTGRAATYGLVSFKNLALAILPVHDDGTIELVGQHRFPFGDYSWEIPEGGGLRDVAPLDSAKRELAEETGLAAAEWREILKVQLSNSVTDELAIGYLATGLSQATSGEAPDETEALARAVTIPVIASGGVASMADLIRLRDTGVIAGAISGRALYDGALDLGAALKALA